MIFEIYRESEEVSGWMLNSNKCDEGYHTGFASAPGCPTPGWCNGRCGDLPPLPVVSMLTTPTLFFYCYLWPTQLQDPQYSFHGVLQCLLIQDKTCPCEERRPLWKFMHQNNIYQNSILARYSVNLSLIVPSFSVRDCFFFLLSLYLSSWTMLGALRQQTY